jgi:ABC-type multidrug transport system fused ATPase/permease subunit
VNQDLRVIKSLLKYFPRRDRVVFLAAVLVQFLLSIIDVLALFLTGLLAGLVISYTTGTQLPKSALRVAHFFGIAPESVIHPSKVFLAIFGGVIVLALIGRTIASLFLQKKVFDFLANRQTHLSRTFGSRMALAQYPWIRQAESNYLVYALTDGINDLVLTTIGNILTFTGELILISLICISLLAVDYRLVFLLVAFSFLLLALMHFLGSRKAFELGHKRAASILGARNLVREEIDLFRELRVLDKTGIYNQRYQTLMRDVAQSSSKYLWILQVPKFLLEIAMVVFGIFLLLFATTSSSLAETSQNISIFFLALLRVGPSLLRLQGAISGFRNSVGGAGITIEQLDLLSTKTHIDEKNDEHESPSESSVVGLQIVIRNMDFKYAGQKELLFNNFSLVIPKGEKIAIVGPSGGGKSTLCDLILGLNDQLTGDISIDSISPRKYIKTHAGSVGLIPQSVPIISGTLAENVALGIPLELIDSERVYEVCRIASLDETISALAEGIFTRLGENGIQLSGGQKQRLGLARALYTNPALLIMDEPTSALDPVTEKLLLDSLATVSRDKTMIVIAHRLSTIKSMDRIVYLEPGHVLVANSIRELRAVSPDFEKQAALLNI